MNIFEFLKLLYRNIFVILLTALICLGIGFAAAQSLNKEKFENTLFISFGVQDKYKTSDSYENLQAADHITESVQGWFKDPSFQRELSEVSGLGYSVKAKKQEKNNILVNFSSDSENNAEQYKISILYVLGKRMSSYNNLSDLQINVATATLSVSRSSDNLPLYLILSLIIGLTLGTVISYLYEYTFGKMNSLSEFVEITGVEKPFSYTSLKKLKTHHQFLIKYLNQKYQDDKIQLLDLTHKNNTGLELLSKYGNFREIKAYDIPQELDKIDLTVPSIIICQLGHTDKSALQNLVMLKFSNLEALILDRV